MYLPREAVEEFKFRRLPAGVLAFSPTYGCWLFTAQLDDGDIWWAALTGENAPRLRELDTTDDSLALVLANHRIEFDPTSVRDGRRERLSNGTAFAAGDIMGFGAMATSARHYDAATAIGFHGTIIGDMPSGLVAYYARWRIVTGDPARPIAVCKVEAAGWPD